MGFENTALLTAGVGSITIFWNQIKSFFSRLRSMLVVKVDLIHDAENAIMAYCWKHFKAGRFGDRRFTGHGHFIKPKNRMGKVAFETTGQSLTFFDGWKPLFISNGIDEKGNHPGCLKISFIRGTFNIDDLLAKAMLEYDEARHGIDNERARFTIRKFFGKIVDRRSNSNKNQKSEDVAGGRPESVSDDIEPNLRPLSWTLEQLGTPGSDIPFGNLSYNKNVDEFQEEIIRWKKSEKWFKNRGLPWRFGAGLFGPPGTGKTSFVRAIGQLLDMPIHIYDLTTMDNEELVNFWETSLSCAPCIVLFEDIDRIFDKDKNIKVSSLKSPLTLDCLLNCINGVQSADGILTLVTANDITKLDPALGVPDSSGKSTRPGRLDTAVYFGELNNEGRIKIAKRILEGFEQYVDEVVKQGEGETGAQFESRCSKLALSLYWNKDTSIIKLGSENNELDSRS